MAQYSVSPRDKKSIEEREIWQREGVQIVHVTVWRGGSVWLYTQDDAALEIDAENPDGLLVTDCDYEYELDSFWDGVYDDWEWDDAVTEEEQAALMEAWNEDGYEALERLGWSNTETETWFYGPLDIEKVSD